MPSNSPYTWRPEDVVTVTNTSRENLLLELPSGLLRLDAGRNLRLTASALEQPQLADLLAAGKIEVKPYRWRGILPFVRK